MKALRFPNEHWAKSVEDVDNDKLRYSYQSYGRYPKPVDRLRWQQSLDSIPRHVKPVFKTLAPYQPVDTTVDHLYGFGPWSPNKVPNETRGHISGEKMPLDHKPNAPFVKRPDLRRSRSVLDQNGFVTPTHNMVYSPRLRSRPTQKPQGLRRSNTVMSSSSQQLSSSDQHPKLRAEAPTQPQPGAQGARNDQPVAPTQRHASPEGRRSVSPYHRGATTSPYHRGSSPYGRSPSPFGRSPTPRGGFVTPGRVNEDFFDYHFYTPWKLGIEKKKFKPWTRIWNHNVIE